VPSTGPFSGATQLVELALAGVSAERALVALPREAGVPGLVGGAAARVCVWHDDYGVYRQDQAAVGEGSVLSPEGTISPPPSVGEGE